MVGRSGCSAGRPSFHRALATATPMVMSENNVIWSCRVDLVARSFQCASACRPKSSFYLLRAHGRRRRADTIGATRIDVLQLVGTDPQSDSLKAPSIASDCLFGRYQGAVIFDLPAIPRENLGPNRI